MAIKPYQSDLTPIGHFDFLDSELNEIQGGEVVVFDEIDTTITIDQSAPDVFSAGTKRTLLRLATGADNGPFFLANVPDGSTFSAPGFETTSMFSQNQTFGQTLDSSSKVSVYNQEAFYVVNSDVVDSTSVNVDTAVGARLYSDASGHLSATASPAGSIVGFFVEWQPGAQLRGFPDPFYRNTRHREGDSIIVYKANSDGYLNLNLFAEIITQKQRSSVVEVDGYYTASNDDNVIFADAATASLEVSMPLASSNRGKQIVLKKIDASLNDVNIVSGGTDTFDGAAFYTLGLQYESVTLISNGVDWFTI